MVWSLGVAFPPLARSMTRVSLSVEIDAPAATVFELLADDDRLHQWMDGVEATLYPLGRDEAEPVGVRFLRRVREGRRLKEYRGQILEHEPPQHLALRFWTDMLETDLDYRLEEVDGRTRLDYECETRIHSRSARLLAALMSAFTRRRLDSRLQRLKALAEQRG